MRQLFRRRINPEQQPHEQEQVVHDWNWALPSAIATEHQEISGENPSLETGGSGGSGLLSLQDDLDSEIKRSEEGASETMEGEVMSPEFIERLKHCKICVIGASPKNAFQYDVVRWGYCDPNFIGFSHMNIDKQGPFAMNWI